MRKEFSITITGKVQGVAFRHATQQQAQALQVVGWVRNLRQGGVEVCAQGDEENLQAFVKFCHRGPPLAQVLQVTLLEHETLGPYTDFEILPTY